MKVTLKEIVDAREALITLSNQRLPIKQGYNVSKLIRKANAELEVLTNVRQDVINRLAPQGTEMNPEINQQIVDELNVALEVSVEIPVNKIDLSSINNLEMTARDIMVLDPFCIFESVILE